MAENRGWGNPLNASKEHYFVDSRSLCGRWLYFGPVMDDGNDDADGACAECKRRLTKEKAKRAKAAGLGGEQ